MRRFRGSPGLYLLPISLLLLIACAGGKSSAVPSTGSSTASKELPTIAAKTKGLTKKSGLLDLHVDTEKGKVWLELPAPDESGVSGTYLYIEGLLTGLGSNPVGLDRGQLGRTRVVRFRRLGGRVLVEEPNLSYRAITNDNAERRAVEQSFARSVHWAGEIVARSSDGRLLVDFTPFLVRDAHGVSRTLDRSGQGSFSLDAKRSVLDPEAVLVFPDNVEFEALLTFAGKKPGGHVRSTAPTAESVSLIQHHSLVRLPNDGYTPRRFDPRGGSFAIGYQDYGVPLDESMDSQWIVRHRLTKTTPGPDPSTVQEPIVYYVDRGTPEPVRQALIEGASWWAAAFEEAGFVDAFRVELMPEGAHPLDVRYNVIQWVHRSTRGWSYGGGVIDPRTGEMIKGHVSLGSLRVRQDRLIFEGLAGTAKTGSGDADDPIQLALARIRQLSAHEVGHTLGLTHNFAASTYADRASVMDYPAPLIGVQNGELDFSRAYGVGVGVWDHHAVLLAYGEPAVGESEARFQHRLISEANANGYRFITDADARPAGAAHPMANLWDNGADPVTALGQSLEVRRIALDRFGEGNVTEGTPLALLHEVFVPVYLHHRYQLEAATKSIGGLEYSHALRGDGQPWATPSSSGTQRRALETVLMALDPAELVISDSTMALLMPRPFGYGGHRELFDSGTAPAFDALGAAAVAADMVVRGLLQPERCARLVDQQSRDPRLPGLDDVLAAIQSQAFAGQEDPLRHVIQRVVVDRMLGLAVSDRASSEVRSHVEANLFALAKRLDGGGDHAQMLARDIGRYFEDRTWTKPEGWRPADAPPGSPIGSPDWADQGCGFIQP